MPLIVVGYDGSEESRAAITYAVKRAGRRGRIVIVHAAGPPPDWYSAHPGRGNGAEGHGKAVLDALLLETGNALLDANFELELAGGSPAEALTRVAHELDADEIVVGSRGFGALRSALGSISQGAIHLPIDRSWSSRTAPSKGARAFIECVVRGYESARRRGGSGDDARAACS